MTDERLAVLAKRGIEGDDADSALQIMDRILRRDNMKTWPQMCDVMDALGTQESEAEWAISVFGHDAARAALALHAEGWR